MSEPAAAPRDQRTKWMIGMLAALALTLVLTLTAAGQTVLVLGVDARPGDGGRSDTMMVVSPRPFHGGLKMLSVPRDTRVDVAGHGLHRINAAFALGGPQLSRETAGQLLGLDLRHHVQVDFTAVEAVVDALGGVTLAVDRRMSYRDTQQDLVIDLHPGEQRLNGEQALGFIRFRGDPDGDISRVARQQRFVRALISELVHPFNWPRLPAAYAAFRQHSETSLRSPALLRFGAAAALSMLMGVEAETLPGHNAHIAGASYWLHDEAGASATVEELFGTRRSGS